MHVNQIKTKQLKCVLLRSTAKAVVLLHFHLMDEKLINKFQSRSLSELTRRIAPRTKNGHAPLAIKS